MCVNPHKHSYLRRFIGFKKLTNYGQLQQVNTSKEVS